MQLSSGTRLTRWCSPIMGTSAQGTGGPDELVPALVSPASGSLAGIFAPFEQPEHALKLLPGPRGRQFPAALRGVVHDVTPRLSPGQLTSR